MDILWLALIIQTIFFIVKNAYFPVLIFIITSLLVQVFSKNPLYFILFPMIVAHAFYYCYSRKKEGFSIAKQVMDTVRKHKTVLDSKINEINNVKKDYISTKSQLDKCNRDKSSLESANRKLHSANQTALSDIATANNMALNEERAKTNTCNRELLLMTSNRDQIKKERDTYNANNKALTTDLNKANALSEARKKSLATAKNNMQKIYYHVDEYG